MFGDLFDFNQDGNIDSFEQGIEIAVVTDLDEELEQENRESKSELSSQEIDEMEIAEEK